MLNKQFSKNLLFVAFSRLVSLVSSVAVGLLLPKIFSITDYGYFKVFTLYAVYTALLHFGFVDGLLLKLAGTDYATLDQERMRTYTRFFVLFECSIFVVMLLAGAILAHGEYFFIVVMLAVNMVFVNITTYYQFISQAVQRFGEYSAKSLIVSAVKLVFVGVLCAVYFFGIAEISYRVYLMGLNLIEFSMVLWYGGTYREITFGKGAAFRAVRKDILDIFKTGILLTMAYQVSHLVLAIDRQFVNVLFSTETFAVYSFAYSIVSMISTMISSISVVLLPMLKNCPKELLAEYYKKGVITVSIIAACALMCYFPLVPFLEWFLPKYIGSLTYIAIVLPSFLFTAIITVVMFTVIKVIDMNFVFFKDSCMVLGLGVIANALAYQFFASPEAISYASLLTMAIWFVIVGRRLERKMGVRIQKEFVFLTIVSVCFLIIVKSTAHYLGGGLIFAATLIALILAFFAAFLKQYALKRT